jgi:hypothetical protein
MVESIKDLKALLKLCRANGVTELTWGGATFKLGEMPKAISGDVEEADESDIPDIELPLSPEEYAAFANGAM